MHATFQRVLEVQCEENVCPSAEAEAFLSRSTRDWQAFKSFARKGDLCFTGAVTLKQSCRLALRLTLPESSAPKSPRITDRLVAP